VLNRDTEVCQLLIDGIVGKKYVDALSFYLNRSGEYLKKMEKLAGSPGTTETVPLWLGRFGMRCGAMLGSLRNLRWSNRG
jgi:hypothetical protein